MVREGRREGGKEGRREGGKEGRREGVIYKAGYATTSVPFTCSFGSVL